MDEIELIKITAAILAIVTLAWWAEGGPW